MTSVLKVSKTFQYNLRTSKEQEKELQWKKEKYKTIMDEGNIVLFKTACKCDDVS